MFVTQAISYGLVIIPIGIHNADLYSTKDLFYLQVTYFYSRFIFRKNIFVNLVHLQNR